VAARPDCGKCGSVVRSVEGLLFETVANANYRALSLLYLPAT